MPDSVLKPLCTSDRLIRSNYYSDTYRASLDVDGTRKVCDITHISIPFGAEKEQAVMHRFGIAEAELTSFYADMVKCVQNEMVIAKHFTDEKVSSVAQLLFTDIQPKESGYDIYHVTDPLNEFTKSETFADNCISLMNLVSLGARLAQITKGMSDAGVHIGAIDMDCVYLTAEGEKPLIIVGGFLYGAKDSYPSTLPKPVTVPPYAHESVKSGGNPTLATDLFALSALLWTLADGRHYTTEPILSEAPKHAPAELIEILVKGMEMDESYHSKMIKQLHAVLRKIRNGEIEDTFIQLSPPSKINRPVIDDLHMTMGTDKVHLTDNDTAANLGSTSTSQAEPVIEKVDIEPKVIAAAVESVVEHGAEFELLDEEVVFSVENSPERREQLSSVNVSPKIEHVNSGEASNADSGSNDKTISDEGKPPEFKRRGVRKIELVIVALLAVLTFGIAAVMLNLWPTTQGDNEISEPPSFISNDEPDEPSHEPIPFETGQPEETSEPSVSPEANNSLGIETPEILPEVSTAPPSTGDNNSSLSSPTPTTTLIPIPPTPTTTPTSTPKSSQTPEATAPSTTPETTPTLSPTPIPTQTPEPSPAPADSNTLTVTPTSVTIKVGDAPFFLKPSISCLWSSSDTEIAIVKGGYVTGISPGTCTIKAKTSDGLQTVNILVTVE